MQVAVQHARIKKWDLRFLRMIKNEIASWSKDPSTQCGAVIARDVNKFVSLGYNGYPAGVPDDDTLLDREQKYPRIIHAEQNAILFAQRDVTGMTLYVYPLPPCSPCANMIIQAGIKRVVTAMPEGEKKERWLSSNAIAFDSFQKANVAVTLYSMEEVNETIWKA